MMRATSASGVRFQRWPELSTTRTLLAPVAAICASAASVRSANQACGRLMPRRIKVLPLDSFSCVPDTDKPACADEASTRPARIRTRRCARRGIVFMLGSRQGGRRRPASADSAHQACAKTVPTRDAGDRSAGHRTNNRYRSGQSAQIRIQRAGNVILCVSMRRALVGNCGETRGIAGTAHPNPPAQRRGRRGDSAAGRAECRMQRADCRAAPPARAAN